MAAHADRASWIMIHTMQLTEYAKFEQILFEIASHKIYIEVSNEKNDLSYFRLVVFFIAHQYYI